MDVVVVGSCMTDLVSYTPRQPKPGETIHGTKFMMGFGGKGANQCVMSSKLGARTAMVAKVGRDAYGDNTVGNFKKQGVVTDHVQQTAEASTGVAPIIVSEDGQNSIVIVAGANLLLGEEDVRRVEGMISACKVLVCQLEVPPATSLAALRMAKSHGVFSIFNAAPAVKELDPAFFTACDMLCANETEAELLTGVEVKDVSSARTAAAMLRGKGCQQVLLTLGEKGSVLTTQEYDGLHIPVETVTVCDTTGAGDAFIGALAYYRARLPTLPLPEAVKRANTVASISCQFPGTQSSFPSANDLPSHLLASP
ncbi:ribokinase-like isoform X2 [Babylonia areolata]|uniref:ribokinase-like isoform X2 n=1 Tax=Babylonia areolata TaxID=304850 RepID=UPI003FD2351A